MTALTWDGIGDRLYQTGIDRGVLYIPETGVFAAWNGLISVTEDSSVETKPYYLDGVKIYEHQAPGDFSGELKAFTYPEEFEEIMGIVHNEGGVTFYDQQPKRFNLSYRTKVGNDLEGVDHGYKLHFLYNLTATPAPNVYQTLGDSTTANEFTWALSGTPTLIDGMVPTCHISYDSDRFSPEIMEALMAGVYGTDETDPMFPILSVA